MSANIYVNDDGDVWVERGSVPWPQARRAALEACDTGWTWAEVGLVYEGKQDGVLVSDEHEMPCETARETNPPECSCCRRIDAYHWRQVER